MVRSKMTTAQPPRLRAMSQLISTATSSTTIAAILLLWCVLLISSSAASAVLSSAPKRDVANVINTNHTVYLEEMCQQTAEFDVSSPLRIRLQRDRRQPQREPAQSRQAEDQGSTVAAAADNCKVFAVVRAGVADSADQPPGLSLLVSVRAFNLSERDPTGVCLMHFLQLSGLPKTERLCHQLESRKESEPIISVTNELELFYHRKMPLLSDHDVDLIISPVLKAEETGSCPRYPFGEPDDPMFKCGADTQLCIAGSLRCDGEADCVDESDEAGCPSAAESARQSSQGARKHGGSNIHQSHGWFGEKQEGLSGDEGSNNKSLIFGLSITGIMTLVVIVTVIVIVIVKRAQKPKRFQPVSTEEPNRRSVVPSSEPGVQQSASSKRTSATSPIDTRV